LVDVLALFQKKTIPGAVSRVSQNGMQTLQTIWTLRKIVSDFRNSPTDIATNKLWPQWRR